MNCSRFRRNAERDSKEEEKGGKEYERNNDVPLQPAQDPDQITQKIDHWNLQSLGSLSAAQLANHALGLHK
jgi:hypothetical protein